MRTREDDFKRGAIIDTMTYEGDFIFVVLASGVYVVL
jgi:hypothetical protein